MKWKETVPADPYVVRVKRPISAAEIGYVVHLYQPLLGALPAALYQTLYHQSSPANFTSVQSSHYGLMVTMGTPLPTIIKARHQLEAIGLLEVYKAEDEEERLLEYELQPPYAPHAFFQDDTLGIMLLNRVGKEYYRKLRRRFSPPDEHRIAGRARVRVTKAFDEVFHHVSPSELIVGSGTETAEFLHQTEQESPLDTFWEQEPAGREYRKTELDYEFLAAVLPKMVKKEKLFTPAVRTELASLAFLYNIDSEIMGRFLLEPTVIEYDEIDIGELRRLIKDWFRREQGRAPRIVSRDEEALQSVEEAEKEATQAMLSQSESHALRLSSLSPFQLMEKYQKGAKIAPADQKIVEELLANYQLPPGVVNVLLEYVMMTHNGQLPKELIYKIAGHWKRSGITTVQEAQQQARQMHLERKQASGARSTRSTRKQAGTTASAKRNQTRKDDVPDHIREQLERQKKEVSQPATVESSSDKGEYERKKQRIAEMLKAMEQSKD
ncbi:replicative DNA helicase loader DnaB [Aneurinibacillus soli]|uniref:Replication initiation and membrane attachment protein n=1 Tax=Aneurinibacillus soli TaxID=1500254 RepID=A0A0U5B4C1_9BACL|nr:DnaD domain protein [Aneurinibacillus soli]PYE59086.1 replicative DNA helicase loader DnaB [Aneurinibacillus soli]BAU29506.1 Replication initiation and membrane attachment protein [Aneurinibacillus soli]